MMERQVKIFEKHSFTMCITALCIIFLTKLLGFQNFMAARSLSDFQCQCQYSPIDYSKNLASKLGNFAYQTSLQGSNFYRKGYKEANDANSPLTRYQSLFRIFQRGLLQEMSHRKLYLCEPLSKTMTLKETNLLCLFSNCRLSNCALHKYAFHEEQ